MSSSFDFARFFELEAPKLRRFLRRFGPLVWAEDIAQDAFARLAAADPAEVGSPRGFVFRVARNLAIDAARRAVASPVRAVGNVESLNAAARTPSPEEAAIAEEERAALAGAIAELPERQRLALVLRKVDGLSPEEIGARLGVSPRQVQRLIAEAIAGVQARLRTNEDDKPPGAV